jgi:tetratricopeptide (TPR) repeat protein
VVARSITNLDQQADALTQVAEALATVGQHAQAETVAHSVVDLDRQMGALRQVAGALARVGQHAQAEAVARSIVDPDRQAAVLAWVRALASAGQEQEAAAAAGQAEAAARSIADLDRQADALTQVVETLSQAGDTHSACRLAAAICLAGRWTTAAPSVLLLDPTALAVLVRVLDKRWHTQLSR